MPFALKQSANRHISSMHHSRRSTWFSTVAADKLNITIANNNPATLIIKDISGRVIESSRFTTQTNISTLSYFNGMIFCEIWQGNERVSTERVIIQHE
jgi:hypothetical protein